MKKKYLKAFKAIQKECEKFYDPVLINKEGIIQNIYSIVNNKLRKKKIKSK